jgi:hypothetical protein
MRNHAVQYVSEPGFGWYRLRREWPSVYESHAELAMETWTKVRVEVAGRSAKLYLNGSARPSLVVDGLKGEDLHGAVGLWSFTDEEAYFSNVRITPAVPQNLKNGSEKQGGAKAKIGHVSLHETLRVTRVPPRVKPPSGFGSLQSVSCARQDAAGADCALSHENRRAAAGLACDLSG